MSRTRKLTRCVILNYELLTERMNCVGALVGELEYLAYVNAKVYVLMEVSIFHITIKYDLPLQELWLELV